MTRRDYVKNEIDTLPEDLLEKVQEYILFQKYRRGIFDSDTDYLESIPGMKESIMEGMATPISECLDNVGWDIK